MYKVFFENWEGYFLDETFETYEEAVKYAKEVLEEEGFDPDCNMLIYHNDKCIWAGGEEQR